MIFAQLKSLLKKQASGLDVRKDNASAYELYGKKTVETHNKTVDGMYFASAVMRKGGVSLRALAVVAQALDAGDVSDFLHMPGLFQYPDVPVEDRAGASRESGGTEST